MIKTSVQLSAIALFLFACSPFVMHVDDQLKIQGTELKVKGLQGWQICRVLSFGEFKTSKVKGGWKTGTEFHLLINFKNAQQKFSFTQFNGSGESVEVYCAGNLNMKSVKLLRTQIDIPLDVDDFFKAQIILNDPDSKWELTLTNPNEIAFEKSSHGELVGKDQTYAISPVRELEKGSLGPKVIGYKFTLDDVSVAAVQTLNGGKVWLSNHLTGDEKIVLAAASSALMFRDDLDK